MATTSVTGSKATNKLQTKDFISIGVFSVLFAVVLFLFGAVGGLLAALFPLFGVFGFLVYGIVVMYLLAKVPKRGVMLLLGAITAVIYFLIGAYGPIPLFVLAGGIVGELIAGSGHYRSFPRIVIGYAAYSILIWFGFMSPLVFSMQSYIDASVASYGAEYTRMLLDFAHGPLLIAAGIGTVAGAIDGAFLGRKLFKKHFEKIGV